MNIKDLDGALMINARYERFKRMRSNTEKVPRLNGYLKLNNDDILLNSEDVDHLLSIYEESIRADAKAIGLELDE